MNKIALEGAEAVAELHPDHEHITQHRRAKIVCTMGPATNNESVIRDLMHGRFQVRGEIIDPGAITKTALMTVEGERDDICAPGQTVAAHALCRNLPADKHSHHLQLNVGHYGVFHGRRWQNEIYPSVRTFIRTHNT